MWNKKRSLLLSMAATLAFMVCLVAMLIGAPWVVRWLTNISSQELEPFMPFFLVTLYSGGVVAGAILFNLFRLLRNIDEGRVFTHKNISLLRQISWLCIGGALICLVSTLYYIPWFLVAAAAAFIGLIVRVVKNVIAEAVALKEENDFTI